MSSSGIASFEHPGDADVDLIQTTYNAVDLLLRRAHRADPNQRILVATVVNLDDVRDTSTFGRLVGQFLSTRLAQQDYSVVHMTVRRGSIVIRRDGEFLLSRDMKELASDSNASAVLVSTYTAAVDKLYVSVKLVDTADSTLIAAVDFSVPSGPRTLALLQGRVSGVTASPRSAWRDRG